MSHKNVTIEDKDGKIYHPETNVNNIIGIEDLLKEIKDEMPNIPNVFHDKEEMTIKESMSPSDFELGITLCNHGLKDDFPSIGEYGASITFIGENSNYVQLYVTKDGCLWSRRSRLDYSWGKWYEFGDSIEKRYGSQILSYSGSLDDLHDTGVYGALGGTKDKPKDVFGVVEVINTTAYFTDDDSNSTHKVQKFYPLSDPTNHYIRTHRGEKWSDWTNYDLKDISNLKQSGVEINKNLVDALNSKYVLASTEDSIKTNANKVNHIKVDRNWEAVNLNPDPLFKEKLDGWEANQKADITFNKNVARVDFKQTTSTPGIRRRNYDINLTKDNTYKISFYVKHTNKTNNTRAYFFNKTGDHTIECGALNTYIEKDNFTRYTATFKPTITDDYKLMILSSGPKSINDSMYIKEIMINEGSNDELFVPKLTGFNKNDFIPEEKATIIFDDSDLIKLFDRSSTTIYDIDTDSKLNFYFVNYYGYLEKYNQRGKNEWTRSASGKRRVSKHVLVDSNDDIYHEYSDYYVEGDGPGLVKYNSKGEKLFTIEDDVEVGDVTIDKDDNVIYSTRWYKTLKKYDKNRKHIFTKKFEGNVYKVFTDYDNNIYIIAEKEGLVKLTPNGDVIKIYEKEKDDFGSYNIIIEDGSFITGYSDGKIRKFTNDRELIWEIDVNRRIERITKCINGYFYAGTKHGGLYKFDKNGKILFSFPDADYRTIYGVSVDRKGYIYVGGANELLKKFQPGEILGYKIL